MVFNNVDTRRSWENILSYMVCKVLFDQLVYKLG